MGITQNKSAVGGVFFWSKKQPPTHHDLPQSHHKFTIEKPPSNTDFSQNPLQKHLTRPAKIKGPIDFLSGLRL
jgi:hypothetical protein